jgi:hypothetical protein
MTTIYIQLLDEGSIAYRPVPATKFSARTYLIAGQDSYEDLEERWEFEPGERVVCEWKKLSGGPALVAVSKFPNDDQSAFMDRENSSE